MKNKIPFQFLISLITGLLLIGFSYQVFGNTLVKNQLLNSTNFDQVEDFSSIIISNIKVGNMDKLSTYFSNEIMIGILGDEVDVTAKSATILMNDFLRKNQAKAFSALHKGQSKNGGSKYLIGKLTVSDGKAYRVYITYQKEKINEISITQEK